MNDLKSKIAIYIPVREDTVDKRLGDYMLRNELGTTRPFGKSPNLNERETQRKNKPKIHEKYGAKSLANNCMNFDPPVPTE